MSMHPKHKKLPPRGPDGRFRGDPPKHGQRKKPAAYTPPVTLSGESIATGVKSL